MQCPQCQAEVPTGSGNSFCEECGAPLTTPVAAAGNLCVCGTPLSDADADGYCLQCGRRHRPARPDDHFEEVLSPSFAAVSDRGLRHERNEDRFGVLAQGEAAVLVVCDGVSSSRSPEVASGAVVQGVLEYFRTHIDAPRLAEQLLREALAQGNAQLIAAQNLETRRTSASRPISPTDDNPPSTTAVVALVRESVATVAWLGDSRAYWLQDGEATQLTSDHSWQNDVISSGELSAEEAARSPKAHAITRWLGADADSPEPGLVSHPVNPGGMLLLCTDGLWNYAPTPAEIAHTAAQNQNGPDALTTCQNLVRFALERGGQDNVTVALWIAPTALQFPHTP